MHTRRGSKSGPAKETEIKAILTILETKRDLHFDTFGFRGMFLCEINDTNTNCYSQIIAAHLIFR